MTKIDDLNPWRIATISITKSLHQRCKRVIMTHNLNTNFSEMVRVALEAHLQAIEQREIDWDTACRMLKQGEQPTWAERLAAYGARIDQVQGGYDQLFTFAELARHFNQSTWNKRTAQLVYAQREHWKSKGVPMYAQTMLPPGWDEVVREAEEAMKISWPGMHAHRALPPPPGQTAQDEGDGVDEIA